MPKCSCCHTGKTSVDEAFLYDALSRLPEEELEDLVKTHKSQKTKGLDFTPDENLGEGTATEGELKHREELLLILLAFYARVKKVDGSNKEIEDKLKAMQKELKQDVKDSQNYNKPLLKDRFDEGYATTLALINEKLDEFNEKQQKQARKQPRRDSIVKQQTYNVESVYTSILDSIKRKYYYGAVESYYPGPVNADEIDDNNWLDNIFKAAIARIDTMGMWGYNESYNSGYIESLIVGMAISLLKIDVYWITAGDSRVCIYCRLAEENSPYPPDEVPMEHIHGRCGFKTVITIV